MNSSKPIYQRSGNCYLETENSKLRVTIATPKFGGLERGRHSSVHSKELLVNYMKQKKNFPGSCVPENAVYIKNGAEILVSL